MAVLTRQAIDMAALARRVAHSDRGAITTFAGLVRNHHGGRSVAALSYSAYDEMAEHVAAEIIAEAESHWQVQVAVLHRIGDLDIGDVAVGIAVASGHRAEAFEACRWVIDEIKRRVPIWKRETYGDGTDAWVDPTAPGGTVRGGG